MSIINCKECGTLCMENLNKLCARCQQEYLDAEIDVAEYLRIQEHSTIDEVHEATKVKKHIILKMIREGRIIEGTLAYSCETCDAVISSGRMCKSCEANVLESLKPAEKAKEEPRNENKGIHISQLLINKAG